MSRPRFLAVLLACVAFFAVAPGSMSAQAAVVPSLDHVFVVVMDNHSYGQIIGSPDAPYINGLLPNAGLATNYVAATYPTQPNYVALTSGRTVIDSGANIADAIEHAGKTWKSYQESMPAPCFSGDSYPYIEAHNPFVQYDDIRTNRARCETHDVPYSQLATDLQSDATTPNFAFIVPDACHDMQDCSVSDGDRWLSQQVPQILSSPAFATRNSLLVLTWAQDGSSGNNQVATILLGRGVTPNSQIGKPYNHYSILRTLEAALRLAPLTANDAAAPSFGDYFALQRWAKLGGVASSGPGVSSWGQDRTDVFLTGTEGSLWQNTWNGKSWSGWSGLGGAITNEPAAVSWAPGRTDVLARGQDGQLYHRYWDGKAWSGWDSLGGQFNYGPAVASWAPNRLDVFAVGSTGVLWHSSWDGRWSAWEPLGDGMTSGPAAVSWAHDRLDVFVRRSDNQMWHLDWSQDHWSAWEPLGGLFTSGAAVASCGPERLSIFAAGNDGMMWAEYWRGQGWSGWQPKGWPATAQPGVTCVPGSTTLELFDRAPNASVVELTGRE